MPPPEISPRPLISPSAGGRSIWVIRKHRKDPATLPPGHISPLESVHPAIAFLRMGAGASRPPMEVFWGIANDHHIFESRLDTVNRIFDQRMGQADLYGMTHICKLSAFVTGRKYKRKPQDPHPTDDEADAQDTLERVAVEKQNIEILVQIGAGRETGCVNPLSRGFRGGFNVDKSWSYSDGVARFPLLHDDVSA
ncbi:hypothetical protein DFH09DRAFT_1117381 [Mycena vulgaris]|nr:hypothetical protein DFH09DRAFT_1117381 [Mycena vulgaris]